MNSPLIGNGTSWVQPKSVHEAAIREQPIGQIYNSITNGVRTMPSYRAQVPTEDRWAIVAYIKALQRSQHASLDDLSERERSMLGADIAAGASWRLGSSARFDALAGAGLLTGSAEQASSVRNGGTVVMDLEKDGSFVSMLSLERVLSIGA